MGITPKDFFDTDYKNPLPIEEFINIIKQLNPAQAQHVYQIAVDIVSKT